MVQSLESFTSSFQIKLYHEILQMLSYDEDGMYERTAIRQLNIKRVEQIHFFSSINKYANIILVNRALDFRIILVQRIKSKTMSSNYNSTQLLNICNGNNKKCILNVITDTPSLSYFSFSNYNARLSLVHEIILLTKIVLGEGTTTTEPQ